jgi:dUTP pyrophosphatase
MVKVNKTNFPLKYYKVRPGVPDIEFATDGSACFDLHLALGAGPDLVTIYGYDCNNFKIELHVNPAVGVEVPPASRVLLPTGLIFDIPHGFSVRLHPRSGNVLKRGLFCANAEGVIDHDYINETFYMVYNSTCKTQIVENLEKICQAEMVADLDYRLAETNTAPTRNNLHEGFGSTG